MTNKEEILKELKRCNFLCDYREYGKPCGRTSLLLYSKPEITIHISGDTFSYIKADSAIIFGTDIKMTKLEHGAVFTVYDEYGFKTGEVIGGRA